MKGNVAVYRRKGYGDEWIIHFMSGAAYDFVVEIGVDADEEDDT